MQSTPASPTDRLTRQMTDLERENERLKRFIQIGKRLGHERDLDELIPLVMTEISELLNADRSTLFLLNWENMELWTKFAQGLGENRITIALHMGIVGSAVLSGRIIRVANAYEDRRFNSSFDKRTGFRTESVLAAPLYDPSGEIKGALELLNKRTGPFSRMDEQVVGAAGDRFKALNFEAADDLDTARRIVEALRIQLDCRRGSLFFLDRARALLHSTITEGREKIDIELSLNLGIAGLVAITGKALNITDAYADPRFDKRSDERTGYHTRCILCVPVTNKVGETLGVIQAINKRNGSFSAEELEEVQTLAASIANAIENAILFDEQDRQFKSILEVLAASIDAKDSLTAGHSAKVTEYAVGIAQELGFDKSECDVLSVAAMLHDYGKIGIDDQVLKKPGKLTVEEFEHIKSHVAITGTILSKMHLARRYRLVPLIANCHHERLDGSGYLDGRRSESIPFLSKILAAADVFEALTAKRHYHEARPPEEAFAIMDANTGTHFDPNVVAALKRYWSRR